jgi:SAM-dependent methyltransferase
VRLFELAARRLRAPLGTAFRRAGRVDARPDFRSVTLSDHEIETHAYEEYLYGSRETWHGHGAFQLFLLKAVGLKPFHTLLDVGCGPLRGGIHAIAYLERGRYCGVDFNPSFIRAARRRVEAEGLAARAPVLDAIEDFALDDIRGRFDFALAFFVLNHCDSEQRRRFFLRIPNRLERDARLYVTHADWFDDSCLAGTRLVHTRTFAEAADVSTDLQMTDWAWSEKRPSVFPILEIRRA